MKSKFVEKKHKVDYLGGLLLAVATTAIVYWGDHVLDPTGRTSGPLCCPWSAS